MSKQGLQQSSASISSFFTFLIWLGYELLDESQLTCQHRRWDWRCLLAPSHREPHPPSAQDPLPRRCPRWTSCYVPANIGKVRSLWILRNLHAGRKGKWPMTFSIHKPFKSAWFLPLHFLTAGKLIWSCSALFAQMQADHLVLHQLRTAQIVCRLSLKSRSLPWNCRPSNPCRRRRWRAL